MELTSREIEAIPRGNLRVPRDTFVRVWATAERLSAEATRAGGAGDFYVLGVLFTCRWLAGASVVMNYPHGPVVRSAQAPITHRSARAHEELIEQEFQAAERLAVKHPDGLPDEPGWLEAVTATLRWAWHGSGEAPLDVPQAAAS